MKDDASLFAAIDLGSNAFRLMIGQSVRSRKGLMIQEVKTLREPVRLAEGLDGGALDTLALDRGWQALARFGKKLRGFEPGRVRAVATSAVREADNAQLFLASAERHLGFRIDVISGHEEARLVYAGVAHALPGVEDMRLVVDIGGGSTELILGQGSQPLLTESIAIGSGTLSARFFRGGEISLVRCKKPNASPSSSLKQSLDAIALRVGSRPSAPRAPHECSPKCSRPTD